MSRWPVVNLRRVAQLGTGHTPSRQHPEYWENCTVPWLTLTDVWQLRDDTRMVLSETSESISELGVASSSAVVHPAGTVAMSRTASVGFSCILGTDMATSQDFVTWTCGPLLDQRFLLHSLRGQRDRILGLRMGSTHQTIYMPDVERISTPLPPFAQQRAIADFLDTETTRIDALIAKKRRMFHLVAERQSAAWSWLLDPPDPAYTKGWRWLQVRHFCPEVTVGVVVDPSSYFTGAGVPFIHGTDVRTGWIDHSALKFMSAESNRRLSKSKVYAGDVIAMRVGEPGRAAIVPPDLDGSNCASVLVFRKSVILDSSILAAFLNSRYGRSQIEAAQYGAAQGVLNVAHARALVVPVPGREDQERIISKLGRVDRSHEAFSERLTRQIELLHEHRQALITAAVIGELDIPGVAA